MAQEPGEPAAVDDLLPADNPIVLYDGVCNLCNGVVQFVLPRDPTGRFRFAPLQSEPGRALLNHFGFETEGFSTFVLIEGERAFTRSSAALRIARHLASPWSLLWALRYIPRPVRDTIYDQVANLRYDIFGRKDRCELPAAGAGDVFLDGADRLPVAD